MDDVMSYPLSMQWSNDKHCVTRSGAPALASEMYKDWSVGFGDAYDSDRSVLTAAIIKKV